uniref:Replication factor C C-terminal domain-containing protein n=1 Tax=Salix viminalis TaxID=40686 RepID=A0A6N2LWF1_SALVM
MCKIQVQATSRRNHEQSYIAHYVMKKASLWTQRYAKLATFIPIFQWFDFLEKTCDVPLQSLSTLSSISQGDLRRAITYLQGAARLFGSSISSKDLISVSGAIPVEVTEAIIAACKSGDFDLANKEVNNVIAEGYPVSQMLAQLFEMVVAVDDISDEQKARICKSLSTADKCLVDGADEYLQLLDVVSNTMRALCNMPQEFSYDI